MPTIDFDGTTVQLVQQKRPAFEAITALVYEEPDDDRSTELLYAIHVQKLRQDGREFDDSVVQAGLWSLADFGVRRVEVDGSGESVKITESVDSLAAQGDASSYNYASVRDGRAFGPAIVNVRSRKILFNGEDRAIRRNPKELVEAVMALIADNRLAGEELLVTTVRVVAALYEQQGENVSAEHLAAGLELATDLGIDEMTIAADGSIEIGRLNLGNALASAVLQGFDVDEVMALKKQLTTVNKQAAPTD